MTKVGIKLSARNNIAASQGRGYAGTLFSPLSDDEQREQLRLLRKLDHSLAEKQAAHGSTSADGHAAPLSPRALRGSSADRSDSLTSARTA